MQQVSEPAVARIEWLHHVLKPVDILLLLRELNGKPVQLEAGVNKWRGPFQRHSRRVCGAVRPVRSKEPDQGLCSLQPCRSCMHWLLEVRAKEDGARNQYRRHTG